MAAVACSGSDKSDQRSRGSCARLIRQYAAEVRAKPARPLNVRGGAGFEVGSVGPIDCRARNGFYPRSPAADLAGYSRLMREEERRSNGSKGIAARSSDHHRGSECAINGRERTMNAQGIGASVRHKEDYRFLTGAGNYTDDINRQASFMPTFCEVRMRMPRSPVSTPAMPACPGCHCGLH